MNIYKLLIALICKIKTKPVEPVESGLTGDLLPKGIKSTIKGDYSFNESFEHIFFNGLNIRKKNGKNKG